MRRIIHKKHSIYMQMLFLLLASALVAIAMYFIMDSMSEHFVDRYMEKSNYQKIQDQKLTDELQKYISEEHLYSRDTAKLISWIQKQKIISLSIYKDGIWVFDSDYPDKELWDEEIGLPQYDWISYHTIIFEDGVADMILSGAYRYQISTIISIIEMIISFAVFLMIVLFGLRRKMAYIRKLSDEVEVLEGGSLEYPITVKGRDELSVLAEGLDSMRKSFLESRKEEEEIIRENQRVITEMSHDLRTPVTSLLLYTEILKAGKCKNGEEKKYYLEKIDQKALQIKNRTDRLLTYSLTAAEREKPQMKTESFTEIFYDILSETCVYLKQKGFRIDLQIEWTNHKIRYQEDYVVRIMDNIMSNIVKYADSKEPIRIAATTAEGMIGLMFQNQVILSDGYIESTGIGIQSIRSMMKEMGGECHSENTGSGFRVEIRFPIR